MSALRTVIINETFLRDARKIGVTANEIEEIAAVLSENPNAGQALNHGLYKARLARPGQGKRGGYRIIYFFRRSVEELYLVRIYTKSAKSALSPEDTKRAIAAARQIEKDLE